MFMFFLLSLPVYTVESIYLVLLLLVFLALFHHFKTCTVYFGLVYRT